MLTIIISGAGIAGLTTALALKRTCPTHHVILLERSAFSTPELGAAIHIPPNGSRIFQLLGFDPALARVGRVRSSIRVDGETMEPVDGGRFNVSLDGVEKRFGAPWWLTLRADLWDELRRLVEDAGIAVQEGREVVNFDPDAPSVTLMNGEVIRGDVVIAADGVHSLGVEAVLGEPCPAVMEKGYNFCYRFLIPTSVLAADPVTKVWTEGDDGRIKMFIKDTKRVVGYPCRINEIQNFVGLFQSLDHHGGQETSWKIPDDKIKSRLLETFSDFHPSIIAILEKAKEVTQWPLLTRPILPRWTRGHMALVGDAAHPMLPHQGQGAAQGIEDAAALSICLTGVSPTQVPERLVLFEKIRRNRASVVQIFSNAGQDEAHKIRTQATQFLPEEQIPDGPAAFHDFNFGYGVVQHASAVMMEAVPGFELPDPFTGTVA